MAVPAQSIRSNAGKHVKQGAQRTPYPCNPWPQPVATMTYKPYLLLCYAMLCYAMLCSNTCKHVKYCAIDITQGVQETM